MHISDLHDQNTESLEEVALAFFSERLEKELHDKMYDILHEQFEDMKENAAVNLNSEVAHRAESFVERLLKGDESAADHLFFGDSSRYVSTGHDKGRPWAELIHNSLFITSEMELRRRIVELHKDLFESERIKDLEAIIDGLTIQLKEKEKEIQMLYKQNRNNY